MNYILFTYSTYLVITISITIWVAKTLFKNGKVFLLDIFHGNKVIAESVNNLLLVGFYLINIGYAISTLQVYNTVTNTREVMEILSVKIGTIILILGGDAFFQSFHFLQAKKKSSSI